MPSANSLAIADLVASSSLRGEAATRHYEASMKLLAAERRLELFELRQLATLVAMECRLSAKCSTGEERASLLDAADAGMLARDHLDEAMAAEDEAPPYDGEADLRRQERRAMDLADKCGSFEGWRAA